MTNPTDQQLRRRTIHVCLAIALLSLVPHLAQSLDTPNGLRVGANIGTTTQSSDAAAIGTDNVFGGANPGTGSIAVGTNNGLHGIRNSAFGTTHLLFSPDSMAVGAVHTLAGANSFAFGEGCMTGPNGRQALAGGHYNYAAGDSSAALGACTSAYSMCSLAVGFYNAPVNDEHTNSSAASYWRPGDSLFVVGNGTSSADRKNALLVTKDGTVIISKRQGDISMGAFTTQ